MLRTSVVLPSLCLTGYDGEQEMQHPFVLEQGENALEPASDPMAMAPVRLAAIRTHGHDLPAARCAAAQRRQR